MTDELLREFTIVGGLMWLLDEAYGIDPTTVLSREEERFVQTWIESHDDGDTTHNKALEQTAKTLFREHFDRFMALVKPEGGGSDRETDEETNSAA